MTTPPIADTRTPSDAAAQRRSDARDDAHAFRDALAQRSVDRLAAVLDPGATSSLPGAGVALADATGAPPADAAALASTELVTQHRQRGIRDRGQDAASNAAQELRSRSQPQPETGHSPAQPKQEQSGQHRPETPASHRGDAPANQQAAGAAHQGAQPSSPASGQPQQQGSAPHTARVSAHAPPGPQAAGAQQSPAGPAPTASTKQAAAQAVARIGAAQPGGARASSPPPFSVERAAAGADRAAAPKPKPHAAAQPRDPAAQVQRGLAQILRQGGGTLSMKLTPNELGEVKIALRMAHNRVEGTIDAQNTLARDVLKQNIDALRASLEQRGVTVDRLEVRLQGAAESDGPAQHRAEARHGHAGAQADAGGDRPTGFAGGGERHAGGRGGHPGTPDRDAERGATAPVTDDGHGRPDEPAGGWLRLDTTA